MKLFEMVAMGKEIHAYREVYKQDADRYCAELDRLQKYLETADIPEELADAIEDARDALEDKYFAAARECADRIRQEPAYQEFIKTWQPPMF